MTDNPFEQEVELPEADVTDETDTPEAATATAPAPKGKATKSTRPAVPDGFGTPVAFAKALTQHLQAKGYENKNGPISSENPIPPQQVYSYVLNSQSGDNRFPTYAQLPDGSIVGMNEIPEGVEPTRKNLLKLNEEGNYEEALAWWDAKDERVAARRQNAQNKAAKKSAAAKQATVTEEAPVEEAE